MWREWRRMPGKNEWRGKGGVMGGMGERRLGQVGE